MICCKDSVRFSVFRPEIYSQFDTFESVFRRAGVDCWITCGTEAHGQNDPHTHGFAIDLRSKHLINEDSKTEVLEELKQYCGIRYFIQLENKDKEQEHFHCQIRKDLWRILL